MSAYQKLAASSQIDFDGKVLTVAELTPYKQSPDRALRHAAYLAEGGFWASVKGELDRIFDELVAVRTAIAKKLGYASFTKVAYLRNLRNCYDPAMVANFRAPGQDRARPHRPEAQGQAGRAHRCGCG